MKDNQAKYPQLRFKGFTDPWEERKSKDLFTPINERNREDLPVLSVTQDQGVVLRNDLAIDIKYDKSTLSSYKVIHPGDFVISLRSFQGGFELSKVLGISSPAYTIFDLKNLTAHNKLYWKYIFKSFKFIESLKTVTFGIRDGKSISFREFSDLKINYPSDVSEQEKIGSFFKRLDYTIALHQRKLDLLKEQKKGYLQKMFPKNGSKFPQLRFSGFADAWEQRKLGDIFSERNERANSGQYKMLSITVDSGIVPADSLDRKDNSSSDKSHYKRVFEGDIAYNSMRMWQGASGVSEMNGIVSPAYTVLKPSKQTDTKFISYLFKLTPMLQSFQKNSQGLTSDTWNLKYKQFSPIKVKIPILNEQMKIGKVLEMLDDSIAANQRKLEKLQELKKGYLQKMFV
ncbi:restriction endonuclease subunit S [Levilactobacillus yonginensis]|uniref:restriction endonuclease subunit S n=1 Tax=Levilactobacillus yonginensis TaxID=1054041 RepID=UPI00345CBD3D